MNQPATPFSDFENDKHHGNILETNGRGANNLGGIRRENKAFMINS